MEKTLTQPLLEATVPEHPDTVGLEKSSVKFSFNESEYSFNVENEATEHREALQFMSDLNAGERNLEDLNQEQLDKHIVALMQYQTVAKFPDDTTDKEVIDWSLRKNRSEDPVIGTTTYTDSDGTKHTADIIAASDEEKKEFENQMYSTHHGMIRSALTAMIQRKVNPEHSWKDPIKYNKEEMQMFLDYSQIFRDKANNKKPIGETDLPLWARDTYKFDMEALNTGDTVIGEKHLRLIHNQNYVDLLKERINHAENPILIVENDISDPNSLFKSPLPTFMSISLSHARENNIESISLDKNTSAYTLELWEQNGFDKEDVMYAAYIYKTSVLSSQGGSIRAWIESLPQDQNEIAQEAVDGYMNNILNNSELIENLIRMYMIDLNSRLREKAYLEKIKELKEANPDNELIIVVGNAHKENISKLLSNREVDSLITEKDVQEFSNLIESIKTQV